MKYLNQARMVKVNESGNICTILVGRSARTDDRPQFQQMIRDSAKKQFDVVLVWKLDRFARNRTDSATYRAILKRNGVSVVSAMETISEGPEGIILEAILGSVEKPRN